MTGALDTIAAAATAWRGRPLPPGVDAAARLHLLDALGVGLAASALPESGAWRAAAGAAGPAAVFGRAQGAAPDRAALVNGALIHALEYDDTHIASVVHGSAFAAPAALAAAQAAGDADGADLLAGYALAWEVAIRLGLAAPGAFQAAGVQVSAAAGAVGAAAAAALIGGLSEGQTRAALAIAGSEASGLLEFLAAGASVKALHPGWAAHAGLLAAELARAGMTGPDSILEGRFGLFAVLAQDGAAGARAAALMDDLGTVWHLPDAAFKLYPCCHYIHPFLEAVESLMAQGLTAETLAQATAFVPPPMAPLICQPWARRQAPASGYDAKWGLAYCLAARLRGPLGVADFASPPDPATVALARRFAWAPMPDHGFPARFPARIEAVTTGGARLAADVATVRGAPGRPVPEAELRAKFRANAALALGAGGAAAVEAAVDGLGRPGSAALLAQALAGRA